MQLLLKDLLQVRMDKLRQQFQDLLQQQQQQQFSPDNEDENPPPLVVEITGMGSVEIALLQKTVQQALQHQDMLRKNKSHKTSAALQKTGASSVAAGSPLRLSQEEEETATPASRPSSQRRVTLRRFR